MNIVILKDQQNAKPFIPVAEPYVPLNRRFRLLSESNATPEWFETVVSYSVEKVSAPKIQSFQPSSESERLLVFSTTRPFFDINPHARYQSLIRYNHELKSYFKGSDVTL